MAIVPAFFLPRCSVQCISEAGLGKNEIILFLYSSFVAE